MRNYLRVGATFVAVIFLALALSCCAAQTEITKYRSPYLGGPNWRVMNATRMDTAEIQPLLADLFQSVEACTGKEKNFNRVQFYRAGLLFVRQDSTQWQSMAGLKYRNWLYVRNGYPVETTLLIIKHEIAHYLTNLSHPEIDPILEACGIPVTIEEEPL